MVRGELGRGPSALATLVSDLPNYKQLDSESRDDPRLLACCRKFFCATAAWHFSANAPPPRYILLRSQIAPGPYFVSSKSARN